MLRKRRSGVYLERCLNFCQGCRHELYGMINLMRFSDVICEETVRQEQEKISETFSGIKLYNAYMEDGQVFVFASEKM